ncbi:MAG: 1,2-phenylacetyl-CoA epoxidase subunit PaaD [Pseudomonadota bacterium]
MSVCSDSADSLAKLWRWLGEVPDPEIPVVSVVDLGIVRDVRLEADGVVVDITPTYSGCPATSVIALDIEHALRERGLAKVRVQRVLSPPWTTDWISPSGRDKLRRYGIAPPQSSTMCVGQLKRGAARKPVPCPRCGSQATEEVSRFGSTPCKASYRCRSCAEPFDYFKAF